MKQTQILGLGLVALSAIALYLHETCRLMPVMYAIYSGPSFLKFVVALIIFLAILTALPEPQSSLLAGLVILSMFMVDAKINKGNALLGTLAK